MKFLDFMMAIYVCRNWCHSGSVHKMYKTLNLVARHVKISSPQRWLFSHLVRDGKICSILSVVICWAIKKKNVYVVHALSLVKNISENKTKLSNSLQNRKQLFRLKMWLGFHLVPSPKDWFPWQHHFSLAWAKAQSSIKRNKNGYEQECSLAL